MNVFYLKQHALKQCISIKHALISLLLVRINITCTNLNILNPKGMTANRECSLDTPNDKKKEKSCQDDSKEKLNN